METQEGGETLEATARLAGRIAHHLNNLLTVVGGNAEYLGHALAEQGYEPELASIRHACGQAKDLSSRLLSISGNRWSEPRVIDLRTLVSEMDLGRLVSGQVLIGTEFVAVTCPVRADPAHLEDVVTELVLNAAEAVDGWGTVRVGIEYLPTTSADGESATGWVQLEVSDSGRGMDRETLGKALHPFFSTRPFSENRGLGLSVAHGIVRQSGGTMRVFSAPGCGTTVRVWLPAVPSVSVSEPL